ncbi:hypothetical protein D3C74_469380 [compost metagenome]
MVKFIQIIDAFHISEAFGSLVFHLNFIAAGDALQQLQRTLAVLDINGSRRKNGPVLLVPDNGERDGIYGPGRLRRGG